MMKPVAVLAVAGLSLVAAGCGRIYDKQSPPPTAAGGLPKFEAAGATERALQRAPPSMQSTDCSVDQINGIAAGERTTAEGDKPITLTGWAGDKTADDLPSTVTVMLVSDVASYSATTAVGLPRPDVSAATGNPRLGTSGYELTADISTALAGIYRVNILILNAGGLKNCDTRRTLAVLKR